jgi:hypothetical protein
VLSIACDCKVITRHILTNFTFLGNPLGYLSCGEALSLAFALRYPVGGCISVGLGCITRVEHLRTSVIRCSTKFECISSHTAPLTQDSLLCPCRRRCSYNLLSQAMISRAENHPPEMHKLREAKERSELLWSRWAEIFFDYNRCLHLASVQPPSNPV